MFTEATATLSVALATSIVAGIIYVTRIEGRLNQVEKANDRTQKDVDELRIKHEHLDSKAVHELTQIKITLARIEGFIANQNKGAKDV